MNQLAKPQNFDVAKNPGLVSYSNTEGSPPPGKVDIGANILDVHDVSVPRDALVRAFLNGAGLSFKLVGSLHQHDVTLSPAQVGILATDGRLQIWSHFALAHKHPVTLSPGDGSTAHDVRVCGVRVGKTWVK